MDLGVYQPIPCISCPGHGRWRNADVDDGEAPRGRDSGQRCAVGLQHPGKGTHREDPGRARLAARLDWRLTNPEEVRGGGRWKDTGAFFF